MRLEMPVATGRKHRNIFHLPSLLSSSFHASKRNQHVYMLLSIITSLVVVCPVPAKDIKEKDAPTSGLAKKARSF